MAVQGSVERSAILTINGQPVDPDVDGHFRYDFALQEGLQTINITAQDAAGNQNTGSTLV